MNYLVKLRRPICESRVASVHWNAFDEFHPLTYIKRAPWSLGLYSRLMGSTLLQSYEFELKNCVFLTRVHRVINFKKYELVNTGLPLNTRLINKYS